MKRKKNDRKRELYNNEKERLKERKFEECRTKENEKESKRRGKDIL